MNKAFEFHEYTASSLQNPDLAGYGRAGWELVAVLPYENRYTFFLQREYILEAREWWACLQKSNEDVGYLQTRIPTHEDGTEMTDWIKVREVIE